MSEFGFQHKHVFKREMLGTGRWNRGGGKSSAVCVVRGVLRTIRSSKISGM